MSDEMRCVLKRRDAYRAQRDDAIVHSDLELIARDQELVAQTLKVLTPKHTFLAIREHRRVIRKVA